MNEMQCTGAYPDMKCAVGPQNWDAQAAAAAQTDIKICHVFAVSSLGISIAGT